MFLLITVFQISNREDQGYHLQVESCLENEKDLTYYNLKWGEVKDEL